MESPGELTGTPAPEAEARGGRLLVIDDEPMILGALRRSLSAEYNVTCVGDGRKALERLRGGERPYELILCDLMMPEMTGMDLFAELEKVAPEQASRMVFVSGGAFTPRAREFLERIPNARVEKPNRPPNCGSCSATSSASGSEGRPPARARAPAASTRRPSDLPTFVLVAGPTPMVVAAGGAVADHRRSW